MKYLEAFRNPDAAAELKDQLVELADNLQGRQVRVMEVCGSHTMAIARFAIRELLPENINLISGPGCPVCVTAAGYIDTAIELAGRREVIIATFGDMINVPGSETTLAKCRSEGGAIEVCYSPLAALDLAEKHPDKQVIFLAIEIGRAHV